MHIPDDLAGVPYTLTREGQLERTLPDGTPFTAHLLRTANGFPV